MKNRLVDGNLSGPRTALCQAAAAAAVCALFFGAADYLKACNDPECKKTEGNPVKSPNHTAQDPCFVVSPGVFAMGANKSVRTEANKAAAVSTDADAASRLLKVMDQTKDPARISPVVCEAWRSNVSVDVQRRLLVWGKTSAASTADRQLFDFMLAALDNPVVEREACLKMGRGNGLERKQAADRLAWLLGNPNLKPKLSE